MQRKLVSQQLYLDAARCFKELGQNRRYGSRVDEAIDTFRLAASTISWSRPADVGISIPTDAAQEMAEKAYQAASDRLKETISQPEALAGRKDLNERPHDITVTLFPIVERTETC